MVTDPAVLLSGVRDQLNQAEKLALEADTHWFTFAADWDAENDHIHEWSPCQVLALVGVLRHIVDGYEATIERYELLARMGSYGADSLVAERLRAVAGLERLASLNLAGGTDG